MVRSRPIVVNQGLIFSRFIVSPTYKERVEHPNPHNQSSSTPPPPSPPLIPLRHIDQLEEEIVNQREEEVIIRDGDVPYVVSQPIPESKSLRKVVLTVVSKDQRWSSLEDYDTYRNSWTWFELSVGSPTPGLPEKWRGMVMGNILAHEHTIEISDRELYEKVESGDVLTVLSVVKSPDKVKRFTVRLFVVDGSAYWARL